MCCPFNWNAIAAIGTCVAAISASIGLYLLWKAAKHAEAVYNKSVEDSTTNRKVQEAILVAGLYKLLHELNREIGCLEVKRLDICNKVKQDGIDSHKEENEALNLELENYELRYLCFLEQAWMYYDMKLILKEDWESWGRLLEDCPQIRAVWTQHRGQFSPNFRYVIETLHSFLVFTT